MEQEFCTDLCGIRLNKNATCDTNGDVLYSNNEGQFDDNSFVNDTDNEVTYIDLTNTFEPVEFSPYVFIPMSSGTAQETSAIKNGNATVHNNTPRSLAQQVNNTSRSGDSFSPDTLLSGRPIRRRGRPRLGTTTTLLNGDSLLHAISPTEHCKRRRRNRRLLHQGKHTDNCKSSSTSDLASLSDLN